MNQNYPISQVEPNSSNFQLFMNIRLTCLKGYSYIRTGFFIRGIAYFEQSKNELDSHMLLFITNQITVYEYLHPHSWNSCYKDYYCPTVLYSTMTIQPYPQPKMFSFGLKRSRISSIHTYRNHQTSSHRMLWISRVERRADFNYWIDKQIFSCAP